MLDKAQKRNILLALTFSLFSGSLVLSAVPVALPSIATALTMNAVQTSWISLVFTLATAIFILPFGRLADILGRKRIFTFGLGAVTAGMIASAFAVSWPMLMFTQAFTGIGSAMVVSTGIALLSSVYEAHERGRALGLLTASIYLGQTLGPTIGGLLTHNFGWRSIFIPTIILQLLALIFISMRIKGDWAEARHEKFDLAGSAIFAVMLFCILYGFSSINSQTGRWITVAGVILLALFIMWELHVKNPILNISLLTKNRMFAFSGLTHLLFYISSMPVPFILSLYLQYIQGFDAQRTGFILLMQPVMMAVFSPLAGRISDRIQPRLLVSAGISIVLISIMLYLTAIINTWPTGILIGLGVGGFGYSFFASPNTNAIMGAVDSRSYGVASAFESTMRTMGITFGMGILMLLFSLQMGSAQITPEYHGAFVESLRVVFITFIIACAASIIFSAARGKLSRKAGD